MKRILTLLIFLIPTLCFSQTITYDSKYATGHTRAIHDSVITIPKGLTGSNNGKRISIVGYDTAQLRYNIADSSVYVHTGFQWQKLGGGGQNFANADLTVTANRTHNMNNKTMTFNNNKSWLWDFQADNVSTFEVVDTKGFFFENEGTSGGDFYNGWVDWDPAFAELYWTRQSVEGYITMNSDISESQMNINLKSKRGSHQTNINLYNDSLYLDPYLGQINIVELRMANNDTAGYKPMVWNTFNHSVRYFSSWAEIGLSGSGQRFGKSGEDVTPAENRTVDFTSTYAFTLNHLNNGTLRADSSASSIGVAQIDLGKFGNYTRMSTYYRTGGIGYGNASVETNYNSGNIFGQVSFYQNNDANRQNYFRVYSDSSIIQVNSTSILKMRGITYNSDANLVSLVLDTTTNTLYRKTLTGGSGTVTSFTFTDGNGFDGTVTNSTTTPTLSLTTTIGNTRIPRSNSGALYGDAAFTFDAAGQTFYAGALNDFNIESYNASFSSDVSGIQGVQGIDIKLYASSATNGKYSDFYVYQDSLRIRPNAGKLNIDSLRSHSDTTHRKPMTWNVDNGAWEYMTYWPSGGGGTPSLTSTQIAYGNGSNLMTSSSNFIFDNSGKILKLLDASADSYIDVYNTGGTFKTRINGSGFTSVETGFLRVLEQSTPSTPSAGTGIFYFSGSGKPFAIDDGGTTYDLTATGSGSPGGSDNEIQINDAGVFGVDTWKIDGGILRNVSASGTSKLQVDGGAKIYGTTSDGSTKILELHAANGASRIAFWTEGHITFNNGTATGAAPIEIVDENLATVIRNSASNLYTRHSIRNDQNSPSRSLDMAYTGSAYASAFVTSGPTGEQGVLYTTGAYPLVLGTNNTYRAQITSGGEFQFAQQIRLPEISTPSTPASGHGLIYFKSDGHAYALNDGGTETDLQAGGGGSGITIGTTTVTSGTDTRVLYNNAGVVGEYTISGAGSVAMTNSPVFGTNINATTGSQVYKVAGSLTYNFTDVGNVGAGEDDLMTYTIPGSVLGTNGDYIEFSFTIVFASNANNKQVKLYYGGTNFYASGAQPQNNGTMEIVGKIMRTGAATQRITYSVNSNTTLFTDYADYTIATETLSGAVILKATGEATSNNDIVSKILTVKYFPGN